MYEVWSLSAELWSGSKQSEEEATAATEPEDRVEVTKVDMRKKEHKPTIREDIKRMNDIMDSIVSEGVEIDEGEGEFKPILKMRHLSMQDVTLIAQTIQKMTSSVQNKETLHKIVGTANQYAMTMKVPLDKTQWTRRTTRQISKHDRKTKGNASRISARRF